MAKFILFSVLGHLLLVAAFFTLGSFTPIKREAELREIEVAAAPETKTARTSPRTASSANAKNKTPGAKGRSSGNLSMKDLGIAWDKSDGVNVPSGTGESLGVDHGDGGAGSGILGKMKHAARFATLYERLDNALDYPKELEANEIQGIVNARLVFSPDGTYQKSRSRITSSSPYLKVLVHRLVRRVFDPRASKMPPWRESNEVVVNCTFEFRLRSGDLELTSDGEIDRRIFGNRFYFIRFAKTSGSWQAGPIQGYSVVPSFAINTEWIGDQFKAKKDTGDPLENYRHDPDWGS